MVYSSTQFAAYIIYTLFTSMTFDKSKLDALVKDWLAVDVNPQSRQEILELQNSGDYAALHRKLSTRIAFGTAGLRSSMEAGFAHMNDVTILQASQGLVEYLLVNGGSSLVVGYDHRHHSQRFAEITASVALTRGFTVYYLGSVSNLSSELDARVSDDGQDRLYVHTPMVPFGIDTYHASGGVMVTASHNPAKDNGYKVYYGNGCQIIPPHDVGIADSIAQNLVPWLDKKVWDIAGNFEAGLASGKLKSVKRDLTKQYVDTVMSKLVSNPSVNFDFVYTPMHGVGLEIFERIAQKFNITVDSVPQQSVPDPDFSTVRFPNPEEAGALDLAIEQAKRKNVKLVVANDPDADRFSVAVSHNGTWRQLTGNEIGILFAVFIIEELTPAEELANTYLVNSTVSSQLLRSIAEIVGCKFTDTLTGFKWIGNKTIDLKNEGYLVPFGYEEAIGYMFDVVNDKDGISAAVMWLQLYEKWFTGDIDPLDKLEQIYSKYGWFKECNGYYKLDDVAKTPQIFNETIRKSYGAGRDYPETIGEFRVVEWRDLTVGYESTTPDNVPLLPVDATSQMITAVLKADDSTGQVRFTCRGSGTEPKLKVYIEGKSDNSEQEAEDLAVRCWRTLREAWFQPEKNGLEEVV